MNVVGMYGCEDCYLCMFVCMWICVSLRSESMVYVGMDLRGWGIGGYVGGCI